jgi:hypothetical protein
MGSNRLHVRPQFAVFVLLWVVPATAAGQRAHSGVSLQAAVGTHVNTGGDGQSVALGFSPNQRWDFLIGAERSHWPTEVTSASATRGGTAMLVTGEMRFAPFTVNRVSPYALAGVGRGLSRPNVNEFFPSRVTNDAWLMSFGGGVRVDLNQRLSAFADMRSGILGERDVVVLVLPVRAGITWRF